MEEQLNPSPGKGKGNSDMQLQDIIMTQEELKKMMENGLKEGDKGKPKDGNSKEDGKQPGQSQGDNEGEGDMMNGKLFEIYQQQQELRQALEERLSKEGKNGQESNLLKNMEDIELDLLNKGFTNETLQKMKALEHQLLKLENATFQQGEDNKRESKTNKETFSGNKDSTIQKAKQYFKTTEILNRHALPLQQNFKLKVQNYFKNLDD